jgi:hypothetical protein
MRRIFTVVLPLLLTAVGWICVPSPPAARVATPAGPAAPATARLTLRTPVTFTRADSALGVQVTSATYGPT